jgi:hypothetical protein
MLRLDFVYDLVLQFDVYVETVNDVAIHCL